MRFVAADLPLCTTVVCNRRIQAHDLEQDEMSRLEIKLPIGASHAEEGNGAKGKRKEEQQQQ
jgi:hypothetical protein